MKTLELYNLKEESSKFFTQSNRNYYIFGRRSGCRSYRNLAVFFTFYFSSRAT